MMLTAAETWFLFFLFAVLGCAFALAGLGALLRKMQENRFSRAEEMVFAVVDELLARHRHVLLGKRNKSVYFDEYGREVRDKWNGDLEYFYEHIVTGPVWGGDGMGDEIMVLCKHYHANHKAKSAEDFEEAFKQRILGRIESAIEEWWLDEPAGADAVEPSCMSPQQYERFCAEELSAAGWDARVLGGSGDQGVDVLAVRDGVTAVFQCKLYSTPLGNRPVQEVHAGRTFHGAAIAAVVSNAEYSPGARAAAQRTGVLLLHHSELRRFAASDHTTGH